MSIYRNFFGTIGDSQYFDPEYLADCLYSAMKGSGSDKNEIISVLVGVSNIQRQTIRSIYREKYKEDLLDRINKELSGDFEEVITGLLAWPSSYDVVQLHNALKGLNPKGNTLIDILCTRTRDEIVAIQTEYEIMYGTPLEKDIAAGTSGDLEQLLLSLLRTERDIGFEGNLEAARVEARKMFGNKKESIDPDKSVFANVFAKCNPKQLEAICNAYQYVSAVPIQKGIKSLFYGETREAYLLALNALRNKPNFYANLLHDAMKGLGTRDSDLIRIIVSRSEEDLEAIKEEYLRCFGKTLSSAIASECSGAYRDALLAIIRGN